MAAPPPGSPAALSRVSAFAGLAPDLLRAMWERMEPRQFAEGETLIRQDDPGDYLLVLLEGSATWRISRAVMTRVGTLFFSSASCKASALMTVPSIPM